MFILLEIDLLLKQTMTYRFQTIFQYYKFSFNSRLIDKYRNAYNL